MGSDIIEEGLDSGCFFGGGYGLCTEGDGVGFGIGVGVEIGLWGGCEHGGIVA